MVLYEYLRSVDLCLGNFETSFRDRVRYFNLCREVSTIFFFTKSVSDILFRCEMGVVNEGLYARMRDGEGGGCITAATDVISHDDEGVVLSVV